MSATPENQPVRRSRFVTLCQQLLALGIVVAALTPAAGIISLDVVPAPPSAAGGDAQDAPAGSDAAGPFAAYAAASTETSVVPTEVVDPTVTEYSLTPPAGARASVKGLSARVAADPEGGSVVLSEPQPVTGYGAVGVTWGHGQVVADDDIAVQLRLHDGAGWSDWMPIDYHDDHAPDPGSAEAANARAGTDAMLVGDVEEVQVRIEAQDAAPADLKLAVIDPGTATETAEEAPALDTAEGDAPTAPTAPVENGLAPVEGEVAPTAMTDQTDDSMALQRATYTPKPTIYSRAQWGADESMRSKSSLRYSEVHAGFVHHTVNANNYTREQVPGLLRSIYAYHTRSLGWSDIGYNYLVDRFGRIWEGRAGGIDRPVVGAHTLGYNDDSFAMSAIGNFDVARPPAVMIQAYGALFAWKLSTHGVSAASTRQFVTSRTFQAINGHRDAGSTACPGRYLYEKLPEIRRLAAQAQQGFDGRKLESNLVGSAQPDVVVRRASDKNAVVIPLVKRADGTFAAGKAVDTGKSLSLANRVMNAGDWDRDGFGDIMFRHKDNGALYLYRGNGKGAFVGPYRIALGFGKVQLLAAVGDMTGDGWPDLMGRQDGVMRIYPGTGMTGFRPSFVAYSNVAGNKQVPVGLWDGDGAPDTLVRRGKALTLYPGNGPGGLLGARALRFDAAAYDWMIGVSDADLTGRPDLVVRAKTDKRLYLLESTTTGFGAPKLLSGSMAGYDMAG